MNELHLHVMDTDIYIAVQGSSTHWQLEVESWLRYVAQQWSRFEDDNELAQLNALPIGETLTITPDLYDCLARAHDYFDMSGGLFSPYLKTQLEYHGYGQKRGEEHTPVSSPAFQLLGQFTVKRVLPGEIDLGGIAKGFAMEKVATMLKEKGFEAGIVDGGGDIVVWSNSEHEWQIGIANPYDEAQSMSFIKLKNGAVATSNKLYRCWFQDGVKKHHILNGVTGEVAQTPLVQATVVASHLCDAEMATKCSFLIPLHEQQAFFERHFNQIARFFVMEDDTTYWYLTKEGMTHAR